MIIIYELYAGVSPYFSKHVQTLVFLLSSQLEGSLLSTVIPSEHSPLCRSSGFG
ncbi:hypothetical protein Hanom_Chr06g00514481 [Helianthus anomalus]